MSVILANMNTSNYRILIVDDERDIIEFVSYNLHEEGYTVFAADDGEMGFEMAVKENPDLILLDIMMPKMDGIQLCEKLRRMPQFKNTLIAFLSARGEDFSQISGFASGGDDYITKPIRPKVLMARIKALLKRERVHNSPENIDIIGCISIDKDKRVVHKDDKTIELPKKEYELLILLTSNAGKVFSREEIYQAMWGDDLFVGDRTLDVYISKLREKLGEDCIKTLKGVGYRYNDLCV